MPDRGKIQATVETEVLIVGAGPAGGSLAAFLAHQGISCLAISKYGSTANTPRAHSTNVRAMECFLSIGLEQKIVPMMTPNDPYMNYVTWSESITGREFGRAYHWGSDQRRKGEYEMASPCNPGDIPQSILEPIILTKAMSDGAQIRFKTEFLSYEEHDDFVLTELRDRITNQHFTVKSKYVMGADGGSSSVAKQLGIEFSGPGNMGSAFNVECTMDLDNAMRSRQGNLHYVFLPDPPNWAWYTCLRMVRPWTEWILITFPKPGFEHANKKRSEDDYIDLARKLTGVADLPVKINCITKWFVKGEIANGYGKGRVLCLGDAIYRHPPLNGLGSNTCIQDAFNLAWKLTYVLKGVASPLILNTYEDERLLVGAGIVERSTTGVKTGSRSLMQLLGSYMETPEAKKDKIDALSSPDNISAREQFREALEHTENEYMALGIESNQRYESAAIVTSGLPTPKFEKDPIIYYQPTTFPGARLPRVWLNTEVPGEPISTLHLCGNGRFSILTGIGGQGWVTAARLLSKELSVPISASVIGFGQEYTDPFFHWEDIRGVQEDGCLLVRPDLFVGWRVEKATAGEEISTLRGAMQQILCLRSSESVALKDTTLFTDDHVQCSSEPAKMGSVTHDH